MDFAPVVLGSISMVAKQLWPAGRSFGGCQTAGTNSGSWLPYACFRQLQWKVIHQQLGPGPAGWHPKSGGEAAPSAIQGPKFPLPAVALCLSFQFAWARVCGARERLRKNS